MLLATLIATIVFCAIFTYVRLRTIPFLGRWLTPVTEFLDNLTKGLRLGPLEQVATVLFLAGATTWVLRHPESPLWQEVTGADASPRQVMLASAFGLIVLITFTVTTSAGAVRDRTSQNTTTYLGQHEHDYLVTRSGITGFLWAPIFPLLIVFLFTVPTAEPLLTDSFSWTLTFPRPLEVIIGELSIVIPVRLLTLSLWCSAFAVVAVSLLLNLTLMLRASMIRLLSPGYVRYIIKRDVEDFYARALTRITRLDVQEQREKTRGLTKWTVDLFARALTGNLRNSTTRCVPRSTLAVHEIYTSRPNMGRSFSRSFTPSRNVATAKRLIP
ncbi:hypothetical protein [Actinomyces qiguomingii]|uniref:hypothetical protein n=1 Tax=Actinomyces qiguomingii TaxID=2057800 RepID=UPI000CA03E8F|nr:hypothetical protein [Actinomyces qiguomingii]